MRKLTIEDYQVLLKDQEVRLLSREGDYCKAVCANGHTFSLHVQSIKKSGGKECDTCKHERLAREYNERVRERLTGKDFEIIGNPWINLGDRKKVISIRCNLCNSQYYTKVGTVLFTIDKCRACQSDVRVVTWGRLEKAAWDKGYVLVEYDHTFKYHQEVSVVCKRFSHETQMLAISLLRDDCKESCKECRKVDTFELSKARLKRRGISTVHEYNPTGGDAENILMRCDTCDYEWTGKASYYGNLRTKDEGCPACSGKLRGFQKDIPGTFYYLQVDTPDGPLYKVGITNLTVSKRFCKEDLAKITVLREIHFDIGRKAYDLERYYLDTFASFKYSGDPVLKSGGNTELFTRNIFGI